MRRESSFQPAQCALLAILAAVQASARGAENADGAIGLEEVVVTAQRRQENLQGIPITVEAISAQELSGIGVNDLQDLRVAVAGLAVQNSSGYASPFLRGVGSSAAGPGVETPIAIYVDGVYYAAATGSLFSLNNIAQIEVLKGPQGTLFGRNATGGLIQVITRDPSQQAGIDTHVSYGNFATTTADLYLTGGVTSQLAADFAIRYAKQGEGYGQNQTTGQDVYRTDRDVNLRSKWLLTLSDTAKLVLSADYQDTVTSQLATRLIAGTAAAPLSGPAYGGSPWDTQGIQPWGTTKSGGVSLHYEQALGFARLQSISAYRETTFRKDLDLDSTATPFEDAYVRQHDRQVSEEIHVLSNPDSAIKWLGGLYYFDARGDYAPAIITFNDSPALNPVFPLVQGTINTRQTTRSGAGFGQMTAEILAQTRLTLGARYTYEQRSIAGDETAKLVGGIPIGVVASTDAHAHFSKPTFRVALDRDLSANVLAYLAFNSGFKSGGFEPSLFTGRAFRPETLNAYEVGLKTEWPAQRLRLNTSAFYYDYKDIQVQQQQNAAIGIINGAGARAYGLDVDGEVRITDRLKLVSGLEYLRAYFTSFDDAPTGSPGGGIPLASGSATGHRLPISPNFAGNINAIYHMVLPLGSLDASVLYAYNSGYFEEADNVIRQGAYSALSASIKWELSQGFSVALWGKNLTNAAVLAYGATLQNGNQSAIYAAPRTFGITLGYQH